MLVVDFVCFLCMRDLHLGEYRTLGEDYTGVVGFFPRFRGRFWGADYPWVRIYCGELRCIFPIVYT